MDLLPSYYCLIQRYIVLVSVHLFKGSIVPWIFFNLKVSSLRSTSLVHAPVLKVANLLNICSVWESWIINCRSTIQSILLPEHLVLVHWDILILWSGHFVYYSSKIVSAIFEFVLKLIVLNSNRYSSISVWSWGSRQVWVHGHTGHLFIILRIRMLLYFASIILLLIQLF